MKNSIYVLVITVLLFTSCKNETKQADKKDVQSKEVQMDKMNDHDHTKMKDGKEIKTTIQKNTTTSEIIEAYLKIKNALVADDKTKAAEASKLMLTAFSNFDMTKLTETQHKEYMDIVEDATEHAEHIVKSPIDHQREHFEVLSNDVNDLIALLGTDKTLYETFCPMYNGSKGGMWLSDTSEIKNPFFGSKMLKCGTVQKQIN